ncbi:MULTISPECIES: bacillithiol system redox-active protein YtxJ [Bacillus]|uniref:Thioredoxin n=2 Tax=Bacillus TaxID=1386 RepID=A0A0M3R9U4_9BACI|nr:MULTISPECIES: bacillithiol system redox-active protein YtxJ [Bacillus]ALC82042.1 hypothetical protein AM592_10830 [Bacillus gobiensis]MBP1083389.1 bacillithiol system protein YtxJ [Bacillus capparidis]MED1097821.1 bacillithiol system redox-active protein YtxJ [Bacillus capparidis]
MTKQHIQSIEEFDALIEQDKPFVFFKHSLTCPISKNAFVEYEAFTKQNENVQSYYLHVQTDRELSNYIAEKTGIRHESPQALVFDNGSVKWHASHSKITADSLMKNL